jgi:hypothetical protein
MGRASSNGDTSPIRIVPLREEIEAVAPASTPQLTYRGGPLLTAVEVVTVYWGSAWAGADTAQVGKIDAFFDTILQSALLDQLAEYSTGSYTIGRGSRTDSVTVTNQDPPATLDDSAIQQFLQDGVGSGLLPAPTANTLFFLYLPSGVTVTMGGSASCSSFCGYHETVPNVLYYAVVPAPDCAGCLGSLSAFDALTSVSSHELCEAITDPVPGQGWYDDANGEIGDICAWQTKQLDGYTVQLEWSNSRGACV